jgi:hypothetical protein
MGDDKHFRLDRGVTIMVPKALRPGQEPRLAQLHVQASGWESDQVDEAFSTLMDPNSPCTVAFREQVKSVVFSPLSNLLGGCNNDPIGEFDHLFEGAALQNLPSVIDSPRRQEVQKMLGLVARLRTRGITN